MTTSTKSVKSTSKSSVKGFANPFRTGSNYGAIVENLLVMGANKWHKYSDFESSVKKTWSGWADFSKKEARNPKTHKDASGKLRVNVAVLMRKDYGAPLHDQNSCIDLRWEGQTLMIRLNTRSKEPMTPGRCPKATKTGRIFNAGGGIMVEVKEPKKAAKKSAPILSGRDAVAFLKAGKKKAAKK